MADARKIMPNNPAFSLTLDADEAGYLMELLYTCVGGSLVSYGEPLGRILTALEQAGTPHRHIRNLNAEAPAHSHTAWVSVYAEDDPSADSAVWWGAAEDEVTYLDKYR
jgi:hypothetical protein